MSDKYRTPKTTELEFGGVLGALLLPLLLPCTVLYLLHSCRSDAASLLSLPLPLPTLAELWDPLALALVLGWCGFQALIYVMPIGTVTHGMPLRDGTRLSYRINGVHALVLSALGVAALGLCGLPLSLLHQRIVQLAAAATLASFTLSLALYARSLCLPSSALAPRGNSGNPVYDFFIGHELNPRVGTFDLKYFCELRPGLIGWLVVDAAMLWRECELRGSPSLSMMLICSFQFLYVFDALWHEEAVLTTMDIVHDGFGFMLVFGDLTWVPFTYSLQTHFLLHHPHTLTVPMAIAITSLNGLGYFIFRSANSQKNRFRRNPTDPRLAGLETIATATGRRLLVSGWWGMVRHPNYLGDLVMALAWSLPCGLSHVLPYFYVLYFTALLVYRQSRDQGLCRSKYGSAWDTYCQRVPYRILPYVY